MEILKGYGMRARFGGDDEILDDSWQVAQCSACSHWATPWKTRGDSDFIMLVKSVVGDELLHGSKEQQC